MTHYAHPLPASLKNPKTWLITGGAGFIGSAVIRHIIRNTPDRVINLDKLTYAGNLESLAEVSGNSRYKFEQIDICDQLKLERVFRELQPDGIMHLAAESHVDRSIDGPAVFIETNIVGTYVLLEMARQYWQGLDEERKKSFRFHHISTDEVYGDLPHPNNDVGSEPRPSPLFTEETSYAPSSPYSASKASSDHAKVYARQFIERCGSVFEETSVSNDVAFNVLSAVQARKIMVTPLPVYRVHRRPQSLTANPSPEAFLERLSVAARLAGKLRKLGVKRRPSATGYMLKSLSYDPLTAFKTWRLCLKSDMHIDMLRLFQPKRWKFFLSRQDLIRKEKSAAKSSRPNP